MQEKIAKRLLELGAQEENLTTQYLQFMGRAAQANIELARVQAAKKELTELIQTEEKK